MGVYSSLFVGGRRNIRKMKFQTHVDDVGGHIIILEILSLNCLVETVTSRVTSSFPKQYLYYWILYYTIDNGNWGISTKEYVWNLYSKRNFQNFCGLSDVTVLSIWYRGPWSMVEAIFSYSSSFQKNKCNKIVIKKVYILWVTSSKLGTSYTVVYSLLIVHTG